MPESAFADLHCGSDMLIKTAFHHAYVHSLPAQTPHDLQYLPLHRTSMAPETVQYSCGPQLPMGPRSFHEQRCMMF